MVAERQHDRRPNQRDAARQRRPRRSDLRPGQRQRRARRHQRTGHRHDHRQRLPVIDTTTPTIRSGPKRPSHTRSDRSCRSATPAPTPPGSRAAPQHSPATAASRQRHLRPASTARHDRALPAQHRRQGPRGNSATTTVSSPSPTPPRRRSDHQPQSEDLPDRTETPRSRSPAPTPPASRATPRPSPATDQTRQDQLRKNRRFHGRALHPEDHRQRPQRQHHHQNAEVHRQVDAQFPMSPAAWLILPSRSSRGGLTEFRGPRARASACPGARSARPGWSSFLNAQRASKPIPTATVRRPESESAQARPTHRFRPHDFARKGQSR